MYIHTVDQLIFIERNSFTKCFCLGILNIKKKNFQGSLLLCKFLMSTFHGDSQKAIIRKKTLFGKSMKNPILKIADMYTVSKKKNTQSLQRKILKEVEECAVMRCHVGICLMLGTCGSK